MDKWMVGDWTKVTGGDHGVVKTYQGWEAFACVMCAREMGFLRNRRQLADLPPRGKAKIGKKATIPCMGASTHNFIISKRRAANG